MATFKSALTVRGDDAALTNRLALALALDGRGERAALMNGLLPVIARHFPLQDVDILGAFGDVESPQQPDEEEL